MQCAHCDIVLAGRPYVVTGGKVYCCERCHQAATRLEQTHAEREHDHEQLIEALVRALDAALRYLAQEAGHRFDPRIVRTVEQHRLAIERLMARLTGQAHVSLDPAAVEQDVRRAAGLEAATARA